MSQSRLYATTASWKRKTHRWKVDGCPRDFEKTRTKLALTHQPAHVTDLGGVGATLVLGSKVSSWNCLVLLTVGISLEAAIYFER